MRRLWPLLVLACGDDSGNLRPLLPEGEVPILATRYSVQVELLSDDNCALDGLRPVGGVAEARVTQYGAVVDWVQRLPDQDPWRLSGRICVLGDTPVLALRGAVRADDGEADETIAAIGRDRLGDAVCEVIATVPDTPASDAGLCDDPDAIILPIDGCGELTAEFDARLDFKRDCEFETPCTFRTRWTATATVLPSLSEEDEAQLSYPLPCLE